MTEAELIQLAIQGDTAAYAQLVETHQQAVFRMAFLILGDADDAADIAQETFIAVYATLKRVDVSRPLCPYLLQVAINKARNRRRALGRYVQAATRWFSEWGQRTSSIEAQADHNLQVAELHHAMKHLSAVDQDIIHLRFFLELNVQETAQSLGIEEGTVKSRLSRALGRLRDVVRRDFPLLMEGTSHD